MFSFLLCSCSTMNIHTKEGSITIKKEKPFCDIKKIDPNCKTKKESK